MEEKLTTIEVSCETRDKLKTIARKDQTYDDFLNEMLEVYENYKSSKPRKR